MLHISTKDGCPYDTYLYTTINAQCASSSAVRARVSTYQTTQMFEYISSGSTPSSSANYSSVADGVAEHRHVVLDGSQSDAGTIFEWDIIGQHSEDTAVGIDNARSAIGECVYMCVWNDMVLLAFMFAMCFAWHPSVLFVNIVVCSQ